MSKLEHFGYTGDSTTNPGEIVYNVDELLLSSAELGIDVCIDNFNLENCGLKYPNCIVDYNETLDNLGLCGFDNTQKMVCMNKTCIENSILLSGFKTDFEVSGKETLVKESINKYQDVTLIYSDVCSHEKAPLDDGTNSNMFREPVISSELQNYVAAASTLINPYSKKSSFDKSEFPLLITNSVFTAIAYILIIVYFIFKIKN